ADTKTYDGTTSSSQTPTVGAPGVSTGDTANFTQAFDNKNAGSDKTLIPSGSVSEGPCGNNYSVTFANNTSGKINPRTLAVSATGANKAYDGSTAATVTLSDDKLTGDV